MLTSWVERAERRSRKGLFLPKQRLQSRGFGEVNVAKPSLPPSVSWSRTRSFSRTSATTSATRLTAVVCMTGRKLHPRSGSWELCLKVPYLPYQGLPISRSHKYSCVLSPTHGWLEWNRSFSKGCHSKNVTEFLNLWPYLGDGVS